MGDRLFNYIEKTLVIDLKNNLCSFIQMNPDEVGFFKSFFTKKKTFPDHFKGQIVNLSDVTIDEKKRDHVLNKGYKELSKIEGEWTSSCSFDDVEYWDIEGYKSFSINEYLLTLFSESFLSFIC